MRVAFDVVQNENRPRTGREVRHRLFHQIEGVSEVIIHTDPHNHDGKDPHELTAHHMQEAHRSIAPR